MKSTIKFFKSEIVKFTSVILQNALFNRVKTPVYTPIYITP